MDALKSIIAVIILLAIPSPGWSRTYYVDHTADLDSNPGTAEEPWKRCPGMSGWSGRATLNPGDIVYFNRGETWTGGSGKALLSATGGVLYDGETWGSGGKATLRATGTFSQAVALIADDHETSETVIKGFEIDCGRRNNNGATINWPISESTIAQFEHTAVAADPQFVDPSKGDFSLESTSPAIPINAGSDLGATPSVPNPPSNLRILFIPAE